jgi:hypothetical protein
MGRLVLEQAICQQKENSPSHPGFPDEPPVFAPDAVLALPQSLRSQSAQTESPSFSEQFGYLALSQAIAEQKASEPNRSVFSDGPTVWAPDAVLSPNWHWGDVEAQGIRP